MANMFGDITIFLSIFLLAALSGMIAERAGVINIAIEGYMIIGALVFTLFGFSTNTSKQFNGLQIVGMILAMVAAGMFSILHSIASIRMNANHIVAGTAMNILAGGLGLFFINLADGSDFVSSNFLSIQVKGMAYFNIYILIAIIVAIAVGIYFTYTKTGLRHKAAGENPNAVDSAGISVQKYRYLALMISAAIAGLAGAIYVVGGPASGVFRGDTGGWWYLALAIMIVGQWRTKFIVLAATIFAILFGFGFNIVGLSFGDSESGQSVIAWMKDNKELIKAIPFIVALLIMIVLSKYSLPPRAAGQVYDKSKR